jgi:2-oxoglutarate/2-oxoacid ferredoxin oxidoreductase subunit beta
MNHSGTGYMRLNQIPTVWCPGCGNGVIVKALVEAIESLDLDRDKVALIGGIGCSGRTAFLMDFNTMHATHGRALAFAAGVKLARPDMTVLVIMGDGDASAIGGNHLIHACRRNIDLTALVFNNGIYGQTGGQVAPTTPSGKRGSTAMDGSIEPPFDLVDLVSGAGSGFVARTSSFDYRCMVNYFRRALEHPGFSFVDVLTACPTYFGRMNELREPYDMLEYIRDNSVPAEDVLAQIEEELGRLPTGIFRDQARPTYHDLYRRRCEELRTSAAARARAAKPGGAGSTRANGISTKPLPPEEGPA